MTIIIKTTHYWNYTLSFKTTKVFNAGFRKKILALLRWKVSYLLTYFTEEAQYDMFPE
jgi:hypothetical protein